MISSDNTDRLMSDLKKHLDDMPPSYLQTYADNSDCISAIGEVSMLRRCVKELRLTWFIKSGQSKKAIEQIMELYKYER